jgi:hypothetical protein
LCSQSWHSRCSSLPRHGSRASTFLPPFPRCGFAFRTSRGSSPLQYYEGSDSCPTLARRTGLFAYSALPSGYPTPNHVVCPSAALTATSARSVGHVAMSRLRPYPRRLAAARRRIGSSSCRLPVRLRLLPTPLATAYSSAAATQLPSATCVVASHGKDSHFADRAYSRTHEGGRPRPPFREIANATFAA